MQGTSSTQSPTDGETSLEAPVIHESVRGRVESRQQKSTIVDEDLTLILKRRRRIADGEAGLDDSAFVAVVRQQQLQGLMIL